MISTDAPSEGDVSKGPALITAICVVVAVTLIVVLLRCSVRVWITRNIWWDDWTIILAMVSLISVMPADTETKKFSDWQPHRRRLGLRGSTLRLWQTRLLSYEIANH